jgi:TolB protein
MHTATRRAIVAALSGLALACAACGGESAPPQRARDRTPIPLAALHGRIIFSHGDDVWVAQANGRHAHPLTHRRGAEFDPSWSPDGKRVVYRDSRGGINNNDEIYVMDADGQHARNLTHSPSNEWSPSWSPDGQLIGYYDGQLHVMRPDGTGKHPVTRVEGEYPSWSRDGQRLAFISAEPGARGNDPNYDVFVVGRDGKGLRRLTDWPGEDGWPTWSPDGNWIAFSSTHGSGPGQFRLYVMRSDGSRKRLLATGVAGDFPVWSPDGKEIMFSGGDGDHLHVVRPDGSGLRTLRVTGWLPDWRGP